MWLLPQWKKHFLKKVNERAQGCAPGESWPRWLRRLWKEEAQLELGACPWRPTKKSSFSFKDLEYGNSCIETNLNLALKPTGNRADLFVELCPRQAGVLPCASGWSGSLQHAFSQQSISYPVNEVDLGLPWWPRKYKGEACHPTWHPQHGTLRNEKSAVETSTRNGFATWSQKIIHQVTKNKVLFQMTGSNVRAKDTKLNISDNLGETLDPQGTDCSKSMCFGDKHPSNTQLTVWSWARDLALLILGIIWETKQGYSTGTFINILW